MGLDDGMVPKGDQSLSNPVGICIVTHEYKLALMGWWFRPVCNKPYVCKQMASQNHNELTEFRLHEEFGIDVDLRAIQETPQLTPRFENVKRKPTACKH